MKSVDCIVHTLFHSFLNCPMIQAMYQLIGNLLMLFHYTKRVLGMMSIIIVLFYGQACRLVMKTFEQVIREEIILQTESLLDARQHGFLIDKSCSKHMINFTNSAVLSVTSLHATVNAMTKLLRALTYFDFSKVFSSGNHDLTQA